MGNDLNCGKLSIGSDAENELRLNSDVIKSLNSQAEICKAIVKADTPYLSSISIISKKYCPGPIKQDKSRLQSCLLNSLRLWMLEGISISLYKQMNNAARGE